MIPIRDANRSSTTPHLTRILIIVNIVIFLVTLLPELSKPYWLFVLLGAAPSPTLRQFTLNYGVIPSQVLQGQRLFTFITSMFLHGDLWHLGGNMLYLHIFGDNVEDRFGHARYLLFYFLSGFAASVLFILTNIGSDIPAIGASGAISGVLGAYLVLYPKARVLTLVFLGWVFPVLIPAVFFLGFWFILQLFYGMVTLGLSAVTSIAYWAHIGGFIAGLVFGLAWRSRRPEREF
ncbi:MAG: rhomboid family intramembrane serine protease [Candidatus Bathyarchaeota archaeon]